MEAVNTVMKGIFIYRFDWYYHLSKKAFEKTAEEEKEEKEKNEKNNFELSIRLLEFCSY